MHLQRRSRSGILGRRRSGGTGRHAVFRAQCPYGCAGSNPAFGTKVYHPAALKSRRGDFVMTSRLVANWRGSSWAARGLILLAAAVIFSGYLVHERTAAGGLGFSSDDAWIHFRFAQNLISGHGFSYNVGQPVAGSTAPLWTLVCAGFLGILGNPVWAGKIAGFICWVVLIWGVFALLRELTSSRIAAWGGALLTLLHPLVIWGALSGLEVMLYGSLIVWSLILHFRAASDHGRPYYPVTILLFLAGVTRPELFSLLPLFWVDRWWTERSLDQTARSRRREVFVSLGAGALVLAPYFAFNLWSIGRLFPLTFYAKVAATGVWAALGAGQFGQALAAVFDSGREYLYQTYARFLLTEVPGMIGLWYLLWQLRKMPVLIRRRLRLLVAIPMYYLLIQAVFTSSIQGAFGRYLMIMYPIFAVIAVFASWHWWTSHQSYSRMFLIASGVLFLGAAVPIGLAIAALTPLKLFWLELYPFLNWMPESMRASFSEGQYLAGQSIIFFTGPILAGLSAVLLVTLRRQWSRRLCVAAWCIWGLVACCNLLTWAPTCSLAVKNINDLNVATGQWLDANLPPDATIAVNDIGAIGCFAGRHHIIDLMGLVEPEILPYRKQGQAGIWEYLKLKRPDYLAIFDPWFPEVVGHSEILERIHSIHADNYILWGYHTMSIYRAHWVQEKQGTGPQ